MCASVADVQFEGKLRIVLKPLVGFVPIVGGVQVYFLEQPAINFDLGGAASFLDLPGLNGMLMDAIQDQGRDATHFNLNYFLTIRWILNQ
jgi:Ca2+-dependent lipid-binding protein